MIMLFSGTPGSGKSLDVARRIMGRLNAGRPVISNFPVNLEMIRARGRDKFCYLPNDVLSPDILLDIAKSFGGRGREGETLLVLDEAQLLFNAREWDAQGRKAWLSFFSQHRKYGFDVILVAQFDRMLDRQIRSLIEYEFVHRKVSNFGKAGKIFSVFALGKLFVSVKIWYPLKQKVDSEFFTFRPKLGKLYDTFADFSVT